MKKEDYVNRIIMIMAIAVVSIIGAMVVGEMYISHNRGNEISSEVWTIVKMTITGMLSMIAGHVSGRNTERVIQLEKRVEKDEEES